MLRMWMNTFMIHDMEKTKLSKKFSLIFRVVVYKWRCGCMRMEVWLFAVNLYGRVRKRLRFPCRTTPYALCDHGMLHVPGILRNVCTLSWSTSQEVT